jgi:hypothetical protein
LWVCTRVTKNMKRMYTLNPNTFKFKRFILSRDLGTQLNHQTCLKSLLLGILQVYPKRNWPTRL